MIVFSKQNKMVVKKLTKTHIQKSVTQKSVRTRTYGYDLSRPASARNH